MRANCRSSGVATEEAIVSGLAPGSWAWTWMTGNSTWGSGATGSIRYASSPASSSATLRSDVATGRRMNGSEMFISPPAPAPAPTGRRTATRRARRPSRSK